MSKLKTNNVLGRLSLLGATLIWGASFAVMEDTLNSIPMFFLLAIRFTAGAFILAAVSIKKIKKIDRQYLLYGSLMGVLLFLAYVFQTIGLKDPGTTPGKNAFLTAVYCILVPFMYWLFMKKRPDKFNISAALVCITGLGFVTLDGGLTMCTGDLLTIICGFFFALHIIVICKASDGRSAILLTMIQFAVAAVLSWIFGLALEKFPSSIPANSMVSLAYLAILATTVSLLFQTFGQKYTPPSTAAVIMSLEAVFGVAFSVIAYGEKLTLRLAIGFVLIFAAIIISETKLSFLKKKEKRRAI